jgi:hypothetical protein
MPYRIFMSYFGLSKIVAFFQSSYDQDELGTVLSVNKDPGTLITYIGYGLLALGLFTVLILKNGRFNSLSEKLKKLDAQKAVAAFALVCVMTGSSSNVYANDEENPVIQAAKSFDAVHADKFGKLVVQDSSGRMKPMDTLSREIVAKEINAA